VWHPAHPALNDAGRYLAVVVEIEDGIRMVGNLLGDPGVDAVIGAPVDAVFEHHDAFTLVNWRRP
jgi:hypothetical protein